MTPVAPLVAMHAITWDAALAETLSRAADHPSATARTGRVHSVHRRAANILIGDLLIAVVSAELDDAPWSIRLSPADWARLDLREGAVAVADADGIRIDSPTGGQAIRIRSGAPWMPDAVDLAGLSAGDLIAAHGTLALFTPSAPQTPFGRASTSLLSAGIERLRDAVADSTSTGTGISTERIAAAVARLIGLGEGLTPSGDDVLTGFSFLASHRGMRLNRIVPALAAGVESHASSTTLLSIATIRSALSARGRQSMHDLSRALHTRDSRAFGDAAARILAIGHSSGADLLTGMRLALELEARMGTMPSSRTQHRRRTLHGRRRSTDEHHDRSDQHHHDH